MNVYSKLQSRRVTSQSQPIPGKPQELNSAGGYSFAVDKWALLDRFLILGTEGGSYYANEDKLTRDACRGVEACIQEDGVRAVTRIVAISVAGRNFKQDPVIFAHALAAKTGDDVTRNLAYDTMSQVCRTGTMLFSWVACVRELGGISGGVRRAISNWYSTQTPDQLAYQLCKYRQRDGWTHRDVLRLGHPNPASGGLVSEGGRTVRSPMATRGLLGWAAGKNPHLVECPELIEGFEQARVSHSPQRTAELIDRYGLTREMVSPEHLNSPMVWESLLARMPTMALVRNLGKMSSVGLLTPLSSAETLICRRLKDQEAVFKSRIHPVDALNALRTYATGHGLRGSLSWPVSNLVVDSLEKTFHLAFDSVQPTGKRFYLALDVSGSMACGECAGARSLTPRDASAAMAMVTARSGDPYVLRGFAGDMVPLGISASDSLRSATSAVSGLPFGRTDCALPMIDAMRTGAQVDCFVIYTDSETWCGDTHPCQALKAYRQMTGIPAKLVVVGMVGARFSIADPTDPGSLDVVGFDTATPRLIQEFSTQ